jgi:hypothetical protein
MGASVSGPVPAFAIIAVMREEAVRVPHRLRAMTIKRIRWPTSRAVSL